MHKMAYSSACHLVFFNTSHRRREDGARHPAPLRTHPAENGRVICKLLLNKQLLKIGYTEMRNQFRVKN